MPLWLRAAYDSVRAGDAGPRAALGPSAAPCEAGAASASVSAAAAPPSIGSAKVPAGGEPGPSQPSRAAGLSQLAFALLGTATAAAVVAARLHWASRRCRRARHGAAVDESAPHLYLPDARGGPQPAQCARALPAAPVCLGHAGRLHGRPLNGELYPDGDCVPYDLRALEQTGLAAGAHGWRRVHGLLCVSTAAAAAKSTTPHSTACGDTRASGRGAADSAAAASEYATAVHTTDAMGSSARAPGGGDESTAARLTAACLAGDAYCCHCCAGNSESAVAAALPCATATPEMASTAAHGVLPGWTLTPSAGVGSARSDDSAVSAVPFTFPSQAPGAAESAQTASSALSPTISASSSSSTVRAVELADAAPPDAPANQRGSDAASMPITATQPLTSPRLSAAATPLQSRAASLGTGTDTKAAHLHTGGAGLSTAKDLQRCISYLVSTAVVANGGSGSGNGSQTAACPPTPPTKATPSPSPSASASMVNIAAPALPACGASYDAQPAQAHHGQGPAESTGIQASAHGSATDETIRSAAAPSSAAREPPLLLPCADRAFSGEPRGAPAAAAADCLRPLHSAEETAPRQLPRLRMTIAEQLQVLERRRAQQHRLTQALLEAEPAQALCELLRHGGAGAGGSLVGCGGAVSDITAGVMLPRRQSAEEERSSMEDAVAAAGVEERVKATAGAAGRGDVRPTRLAAPPLARMLPRLHSPTAPRSPNSSGVHNRSSSVGSPLNRAPSATALAWSTRSPAESATAVARARSAASPSLGEGPTAATAAVGVDGSVPRASASSSSPSARETTSARGPSRSGGSRRPAEEETATSTVVLPKLPPAGFSAALASSVSCSTTPVSASLSQPQPQPQPSAGSQDRRVDDLTVKHRDGSAQYSISLTYHDTATGSSRTIDARSLPPLSLDRRPNMPAPSPLPLSPGAATTTTAAAATSAAGSTTSARATPSARPSAGTAGALPPSAPRSSAHGGLSTAALATATAAAAATATASTSAALHGASRERGGGRCSSESVSSSSHCFGAPLPPTEPTKGPRLQGVAGRRGEMAIGAFLGGGACGKVYECLNTETGHTLAAKQIVFDAKDAKVRQRLRQLELELEVLTLAARHHVRWIVGFYGAEKRGHSVLMYLEYCEHGSLLDYMAEGNSEDAAVWATTCGTLPPPPQPSLQPFRLTPNALPEELTGQLAHEGAAAAHTPTRHPDNGAAGDTNAAGVTPQSPSPAATSLCPCQEPVVHAVCCSAGEPLASHNANTNDDDGAADVRSSSSVISSSSNGLPGFSYPSSGVSSVMGSVALSDAMRPQMAPLSIAEVRRFTGQMVAALYFLHQHHYAHLDVKTANVLVTADGESRLADLGCAMRLQPAPTLAAPYPVLQDHDAITELRGTALYMAPEMIRFERPRIGSPADVWSMGCVVMEMATGSAPWRHLARDKLRVLFRIGSAREELPLPPLIRAWADEARERLEQEELFEAPSVAHTDGRSTVGTETGAGERDMDEEENEAQPAAATTTPPPADAGTPQAPHEQDSSVAVRPREAETEAAATLGLLPPRRCRRVEGVAGTRVSAGCARAYIPVTPGSEFASEVAEWGCCLADSECAASASPGATTATAALTDAVSSERSKDEVNSTSLSEQRQQRMAREQRETLLRYVALEDFVRCCLRVRPGDRSTAEQLIQHPFLTL